MFVEYLHIILEAGVFFKIDFGVLVEALGVFGVLGVLGVIAFAASEAESNKCLHSKPAD